MSPVVNYEVADSIATISIDDGKANVLSPSTLAELNAALDNAEADQAVVILTGRPGLFSGGFDLKVLRGAGAEAVDMLRHGFELAERLMTFPTPVVMACGGHAIAMASFLMLSGDYRVGAAGDFRIGANEVAIGMTMPRAALEICRDRLAPTYVNRAVMLAEMFSPEDAVLAGFLDTAVAPDDVQSTARDAAARFQQLDMPAHTSTKRRARRHTLAALRTAIEADDAELKKSL
jgi:enoyl-CoA hydratase